MGGGGKPKIYIVTSHLNQHKKNIEFDISCSCYIQAGSALTDIRLCEVLDNVGDNISNENEFFCELSAGYWIYKNDNIHDYLGLYHYSRGLDISDEDICAIMSNKIDVVLPAMLKCSQQLACRLHFMDIEVIMQALSSKEEIAAFERYLLGNTFYVGNIVFARSEIFKNYYAWMFNVIRKCEKYMNEKGISIPKRLWGYYGEHLTNVYFLNKDFKVIQVNLKA